MAGPPSRNVPFLDDPVLQDDAALGALVRAAARTCRHELTGDEDRRDDNTLQVEVIVRIRT